MTEYAPFKQPAINAGERLRAMVKAAPKVAKAQAANAGEALAKSAGLPIVQHTVQKTGKVIPGVVVRHLSDAQAKQINDFVWKKDGGHFFRLSDLGRVLDKFPLPAAKSPGSGPAVHSLSDHSVALLPDERVTDTVAAREVDQRIGQFAHQPPILIRESALGNLPGATAASNISGAVHDGAIYLFLDQLGSKAEVPQAS